MSLEQRAILKLAEEKAANAIGFLRKNYPQLAREQLRAALADIELAELLGRGSAVASPHRPTTIEI